MPKSRFGGVTWDAEKGLWAAHVNLDGYSQHVGYYRTEEEAAEAGWVRLGHSGVRDADGYDREQDERWDSNVVEGDFVRSGLGFIA